MLKKARTRFASTLCLASALYLGYAFWDICLSAILPHSLEALSVLVAGTGFFLVLRWLKKEDRWSNMATESFEHKRPYILPNAVKAALETEDVWGHPLRSACSRPEMEKQHNCVQR